MKLLDYLGHVVRVKTRAGITYVGFALQHHYPEEARSGKEKIVIETPVVEIIEDEIEKIDIDDESKTKKLTLLTIDEISNELSISNEIVVNEINKIKHTDYNIGNDTIMYDLDTAFEVAANLGKTHMFDWYCDNCDEYLNEQEGFENNKGKWKCTKCGFENIISKENLK